MPPARDFGGNPVFALLGAMAEGERLKKEDQSKREAEAFRNLYLQDLSEQAKANAEATRSRTQATEAERAGESEALESLAQYYASPTGGGLDPEAARARATFETRTKGAPQNIAKERADAKAAEALSVQRRSSAGASSASADLSRARAEDVRTRGERDPLAGMSGFERGQVRLQIREEAGEYVKRFGGPEAALQQLDQQANAYMEALAAGQFGDDPEADHPSAEELMQSYLLLRAELQAQRLKDPRKGAVTVDPNAAGSAADLSSLLPQP